MYRPHVLIKPPLKTVWECTHWTSLTSTTRSCSTLLIGEKNSSIVSRLNSELS